MSLDNIELPQIVLQDLYKNVLVDTGTKKAKATKEKTSGISFLGKNQKHITIVCTDENTIYLPDEALNFLMGVLGACKLNMQDVALVNFAKADGLNYTQIEKELSAAIILLFDITPAQLALPLEFPAYQIQKYNGQVYLAAPSLSVIAADKVEKTKLWNCLKTLFSI